MPRFPTFLLFVDVLEPTASVKKYKKLFLQMNIIKDQIQKREKA